MRVQAKRTDKLESRPQVVVAHMGARMHYAVPLIFERAGMLKRFYTDIFLPPGIRGLMGSARLARLFGSPWQRLAGRFTPELPEEKVTSFPGLGLMLAGKHRMAGGNILKEHQVNLWAAQNFARKVTEKGFEGAEIIYTIMGEGLDIVTHGAARNRFIVTEIMIAPDWYSLLLEEHHRWPGWGTPINEDQFKRIAEFDLERLKTIWLYSDLIVCPSEFVRESVISLGGAAERCVVVPYGYDSDSSFLKLDLGRHGSPRLKLLFVGRVSLRKGIQYLNEAVKLLKTGMVTIDVVGTLGLSDRAVHILQQKVNLRGPVPRSEMPKLYAKADVLVFPTICEGSATVTYEALAAGLPVITTPNAGSVVRDGVDGFIVPIRDPEALAEKMELLAENPGLLASMSQNARERALDFSLEKYGERLVRAILSSFS
jgi:glycosyltransferase involved in cell wall biosynthesis